MVSTEYCGILCRFSACCALRIIANSAVSVLLRARTSSGLSERPRAKDPIFISLARPVRTERFQRSELEQVPYGTSRSRFGAGTHDSLGTSSSAYEIAGITYIDTSSQQNQHAF